MAAAFLFDSDQKPPLTTTTLGQEEDEANTNADDSKGQGLVLQGKEDYQKRFPRGA